MAVTEFALLRLIPPTTAPNPSLLSHLKTAKDAMESFSGYPFTYYHCLEDPTVIFIVGGWPSAKFHWEEWIPSSQNQEMLTTLKDEVDVEFMFHVDLDCKSLDGVESQKVVAFVRHKIKAGAKTGFEKTFNDVKGGLEKVIGGGELVRGGWRVEKGFVKGEEVVTDGMSGENDEWVLFSGWQSKESHEAFGHTEESKRYGKIFEFVETFDIQHCVKLDV